MKDSIPANGHSLAHLDKTPYKVTVEGSLGLLALGYQGLVAWRSKRKEEEYNFSEHLFIPKPAKKEK